MSQNHSDRYSELQHAFVNATGRELLAFAVLGIDANGETYYGACVPADHVKAMERLAGQLMAFVRQQKRRVAKEAA